MPKKNTPLDDLLGEIWLVSYRYTWIFAAAGLISAYIGSLASWFTRSRLLSAIIGIALSLLIEWVVKPVFTRGLLWFNKHSEHPEKDPRLLPFFDGWSAFLTAIILFVVLDGVFHVRPDPNVNMNFYLTGVSAAIFFLILIYGILTRKI